MNMIMDIFRVKNPVILQKILSGKKRVSSCTVQYFVLHVLYILLVFSYIIQGSIFRTIIILDCEVSLNIYVQKHLICFNQNSRHCT